MVGNTLFFHFFNLYVPLEIDQLTVPLTLDPPPFRDTPNEIVSRTKFHP